MAKIADHLLDELSCVLTEHEETKQAPVRCLEDELVGPATMALVYAPRYIEETREERILRCMSKHTGMQQYQIAKRTKIDAKRVKILLIAMEKRGIVTREKKPGFLDEWRKA